MVSIKLLVFFSAVVVFQRNSLSLKSNVVENKRIKAIGSPWEITVQLQNSWFVKWITTESLKSSDFESGLKPPGGCDS